MPPVDGIAPHRSHSLLFSDLILNNLRLGNRLAVAPMTRTSATDDGLATQQMVDYYAAFAHGGFALVHSEGIYTDEAYSQGYARQPGLANDDQLEAWRPVVQAVHAGGAVFFAQLMHAGALAQHNRFRPAPVAPSAVRPKGEQLRIYGGSGPFATPAAMGAGDIEEAIAGFGAAARRARQAGFDGVELHGGDGYLIDQFLTAAGNRRRDAYGGCLERRLRFAVETIKAVRGAVGADFPIAMRLSQSKVNEPAHRWQGVSEAAAIFRTVAAAGLDMVHVTNESAIEPVFDSGETFAALAARHTGLPVIANGQLETPARAQAILASGADIVALGRGALANPDWPQRVYRDQALEAFDPLMLLPQATLEAAERWRRTRRSAS